MILLALGLYASVVTIYAVTITAMHLINKPSVKAGRSGNKVRTIADVQRGEIIRYRTAKALTGITNGLVMGNDPINRKICVKTNWNIVNPDNHDEIIRKEVDEYIFNYNDYAVIDFQVLNPHGRMVAQRSTYDLLPLLHDKLHDAEQNNKNEEAGIIRSCIISLQKIKRDNSTK